MSFLGITFTFCIHNIQTPTLTIKWGRSIAQTVLHVIFGRNPPLGVSSSARQRNWALSLDWASVLSGLPKQSTFSLLTRDFMNYRVLVPSSMVEPISTYFPRDSLLEVFNINDYTVSENLVKIKCMKIL